MDNPPVALSSYCRKNPYAQDTVDAWLDGMTTAISNAQKRKAQGEQKAETKAEQSNTRMFMLNDSFVTELREWYKGDRNGNKRFYVGRTSKVLTAITGQEKDIYWYGSKINEIKKKHHNMTLPVIEQVPHILESPVMVLDSKTVDGRIVMFGDVYDKSGNPVLAAVELSASNGSIDDFVLIASAYAKGDQIRNIKSRTEALQNFINESNVRYVTEDKKRIQSWLKRTGLQLPIGVNSGFNDVSISDSSENVNRKMSLNDSADSRNLQAELYELKSKRSAMLEENEAYRMAEEQVRYAKTFFERVEARRALNAAMTMINTAEIDQRISELRNLIDIARDERNQRHRQEQEKYSDVKTAGYSAEPDTRSKSLDKAYEKAIKEGNTAEAEKIVNQAAEAAMPKSVVRDEQGKLLHVYHYTNNDFTVFDRSRARTGNEMDGFFFAPDPDSSREYGNKRITAYLNITNLAVDPILNREFEDSGTLLRKKLASQGYDGIARTENGEIYEYMVFDPEQIKSADPIVYDDAGNVIPLSERFNRENPDIRFSLNDSFRTDQAIRKVLGKAVRRSVQKILVQLAIFWYTA